MKINVMETTLSVFLLKDIDAKDAINEVCRFIDKGMAQEPDLLELHNANKYKGYIFNSLYPLEENKVYKKGSIYHIQLRTINKDLGEFFDERLPHCYDDSIKGLTATTKIIAQKPISRIYSIMPVIIKTDEGYWKGKISLEEFERRIVENLIKKYNDCIGVDGDKLNEEGLQLYNEITFENKKPVSFPYKKIKLLGDKVTLQICDNERAQQLAYLSLGTGIGELGARGAGFVNYKWV